MFIFAFGLVRKQCNELPADYDKVPVGMNGLLSAFGDAWTDFGLLKILTHFPGKVEVYAYNSLIRDGTRLRG